MNLLKFEYVNYKGARKIRTIEPKQIVYGKTPNLDHDEWLLDGIDVEKNERRLFVMKHIVRFIDEKIQRFMCVTIYVLNNKNELLMLHHNKLNRWCPPGGKVDNDETPDQAAIRECFEETGVRIDLIGEKPDFDSALVTPLGVQCNIIKPNEREHVDLLYVARAQNEDLHLSKREAKDIGWFNLDQVEKSGTFENVIYWYKKILKTRIMD